MKELGKEIQGHTNYFCEAESQSYESVSEGHDCCYDREPCHVMKIRYLRYENLDTSE